MKEGVGDHSGPGVGSGNLHELGDHLGPEDAAMLVGQQYGPGVLSLGRAGLDPHVKFT